MPKLEQYAKQSVCLTPKFDRKKWKQKFSGLSFQLQISAWRSGTKLQRDVFNQTFDATCLRKSSMHWNFIWNLNVKVQCKSSMHWTFRHKVQCKSSMQNFNALNFYTKSSMQKFNALNFWAKVQRKSSIRDQNMFFVWNAGSGLIFVRFPWWNLETLKVCGELRIKLYRRKKPPTVQNDRRMCRWRMGTHHRKTFWEPSQRDKQCLFPIGITEQIGKVSTSMWYRKNWGAALCLWLRRRLNFHFFVAGFAHEFGLHSMPKIRARTQPFKNMCLAWKPIEQGFENSIHSLVMVALSQKKPWTHIW